MMLAWYHQLDTEGKVLLGLMIGTAIILIIRFLDMVRR